jgi:hypothetical protein
LENEENKEKIIQIGEKTFQFDLIFFFLIKKKKRHGFLVVGYLIVLLFMLLKHLLVLNKKLLEVVVVHLLHYMVDMVHLYLFYKLMKLIIKKFNKNN